MQTIEKDTYVRITGGRWKGIVRVYDQPNNFGHIVKDEDTGARLYIEDDHIQAIKAGVKGRLLQFFGEWKVQSGYGTFPLSKTLQAKPTVESNGAWVTAQVRAGQVEDYHFETEALD